VRRALGPLCALTVAASSLGAQALVGVYPAGVGLDSGGRASVPLFVDLTGAAGTMLGSYQLQLTWNPAVIRYVSAGPGAFGAPTVNAANAAAGSLTLAGANPGGVGGLFSVALVTFEKLTGTGSSPVAVASPALTAAGTFAAITATTTPAQVCASSGAFGDVNRDGTIQASDALIVVTAAVGLPIAPYTLVNADVDGDADSDTRDALGILSSAVGLATAGFRIGVVNAPCAGAPAVTLALTPGSAQLAPGDLLPIAAQVFDSTGALTAATGLAWGSNAPGVATVDSAGRVKAVGNGSATITAMAIGGVTQTVGVTVQPRHTWYVEQSVAAANAVQLGSVAYPFATIQQGLDAAAPRDTVRVGSSPPYGPITIAKPVVLLGDSTAAGMPAITNAAGPAVTVGSPGLVVIRRFRLLESNAGIEAGLVAPGDSLEIQSVVATSMRGPGFRVRNTRRAVLLGVSGSGLALAGFLAETTAAVVVDGADFRAIAPAPYPDVEGLVSIGVALVVGDSLRASRVTVLGASSERAVSLGASFVERVELSQFDLAASGPIKVDSARYVALSNGVARTLQDGIVISADTALVANVALRQTSDGVRIGPRNRTGPTPGSLVRVSRAVVDSVSLGNGLSVTGIDRVIVDSTTVANVLNGAGIVVDPTSLLALRADTLRDIADEALRTDSVGTVSLVGLRVTGSARPSFERFGASIFAVTVLHADSVRLDSTAVVDNLGGGVLVDSARVVHGDATTIARNLGLRAQICEFGCEIIPGGAPARSQALYSTTQAPGMALAAVQTARLDRFVVDSNPYGGLDADMTLLPGPTLAIQGGLIGGGLYAIRAAGDPNAPSGRVSVDGTWLRNAESGIAASHFTDFSLTRARLDSIPSRQSQAAVQLTDVATVTITDDTLTGGLDAGIRVDGSNVVDIRRVAIRGFRDSCGECGDFALSLSGIQTSALVYGGRLEQNEISGANVFASAGTITFDSMVVLGHSSRGLQLSSPATVRQSLFQGNGTGINVFSGAEGSTIVNNNFEGNTFYAVANGTAPALDAGNNWWNDALGPSGCTTCNLASVGDPVSDNVIFDPVLAAPYGPAPLPVPPAPPPFGAPRRVTAGGRP
jgi:hypothetical protein